jgi:exopolysaccharide biosynthesis polyprenyl glycosylphosphotransferase
VFFIGTEAQYFDLAREAGRRGDVSIVGWASVGSVPRSNDDRADLNARIARVRPTTLVMSAEASRLDDCVSLASSLHSNGVRIRLLNDFYEQRFAKVPLSELTRAWFLFDVAEIHHARVYGSAKRAFETLLAGLLLLLSLPVLAAVALLVRASSPGPVFFRQTRVGKNGRLFAVTKFRTMTHDPPSAGWATEHAARITPVGRRLRRYRLDELPQLWNVITGDLSLVGPRPEQPEIVQRLSDSIDFYAARQTVRPGITGWAQIHHGYGGSLRDTLEKLQYDFFYIRHQSLKLDLLIVGATVRTILAGGGR